MKIAVTSASGKLGGKIVENLVPLIGKENVIAIARTTKNAEYLGVEIRKGDYNSREDFDSALKGVDTLLLVSGLDAPDKRIEQHRNVIDAAKANGVKKIVYTSIIGEEVNNSFSPVVQSNRQTEADVQGSGLNWTVGRNGIYIEPDLEYIDTYLKEGEIRNCAGAGKCTYTSRNELGYAYAKLLIEDKHNQQVYNLVGNAITQSQLATYMNHVFYTDLSFNSISVAEYTVERKKALGDFFGNVVAGIYTGIKNGVNDVSSDFEKAAGRPHKSTIEMMQVYKNSQA